MTEEKEEEKDEEEDEKKVMIMASFSPVFTGNFTDYKIWSNFALPSLFCLLVLLLPFNF